MPAYILEQSATRLVLHFHAQRRGLILMAIVGLLSGFIALNLSSVKMTLNCRRSTRDGDQCQFVGTYRLGGSAIIWTRPLSRINPARVSESDGKAAINLSDTVGPVAVSRDSAEQAARTINDFLSNSSAGSLSLPLPQDDDHLPELGISGLGLGLSVFCVLRAFQTQTITLDKLAGEITLQSRGLLGTRTRIETLADVIVVENGTSRRTRQTIQAVRIIGNPLPLGRTDNPEILARIRQFLNLPDA